MPLNNAAAGPYSSASMRPPSSETSHSRINSSRAAQAARCFRRKVPEGGAIMVPEESTLDGRGLVLGKFARSR